METLANAIKLAQVSLGLDDDEFDSIGYCSEGGDSWTVSFFLDNHLVGKATEDGS